MVIKMNRKMLPLVLMLTAGAFTAIMTFVFQYPLKKKLLLLLIVLFVFYFLGSLMKWFLDYFEKQNESKAKEEGEVIEKEATEATEEKKEAVLVEQDENKHG